MLERSESLNRRKQLYEELHPETKHGAMGGGRDGKGTRLKTEDETISFSADTAAKTDMTPRTIQQEVQIAPYDTNVASSPIKSSHCSTSNYQKL